MERDRQRVFLFDADAARERCEAMLRDWPLRNDFRRYWFSESHEHSEWLRLRSELARKGIRLPEYLFEAENLRPLLDSLYSAEAGKPCAGWDFHNLVVLAHHVHTHYKGHLWAFRLMLLAHNRIAVIKVHDTTGKWAAKAKSYRESWRDGKADFAPDRRHDALVAFLFPEIAADLPKTPSYSNPRCGKAPISRGFVLWGPTFIPPQKVQLFFGGTCPQCDHFIPSTSCAIKNNVPLVEATSPGPYGLTDMRI